MKKIFDRCYKYEERIREEEKKWERESERVCTSEGEWDRVRERIVLTCSLTWLIIEKYGDDFNEYNEKYKLESDISYLNNFNIELLLE